jgi:hypothetical protein
MNQRGWCAQAVEIVEGLFGESDSLHWDQLLDLRGLLIKGNDWGRTLDILLECRERLESDHYLQLYRLRRLVGSSLMLEGVAGGSSLERLLSAPPPTARRRWAQSKAASLRLVEAS